MTTRAAKLRPLSGGETLTLAEACAQLGGRHETARAFSWSP